MTEEIGAREFKQNASEVLRRVREEGATYTVTYRGKAVAKLIPADEDEFDQKKFDQIWREMDELAHEVGKRWPKGLSAVDAVREQRR